MKQVKSIIKISKIPKSCRERHLNMQHVSAAALRRKGIVTSGVSNLRRGYQMGNPNSARRYMLIITIRGEGRLLSANGEEYLLDGGSIIVHPPGFPCIFYVEDDCWDIIWFYFKDYAAGMEKFAGKIFFWHDLYKLSEIAMLMEAYLHECEHIHGANERHTETAAENYAELIMITLERILERNSAKCKKDYLRETVDSIWLAVRQDVSRAWQVPGLARQAGMSQSSFQRYMRRVFNCSPKQMLLNIRMEEAKHLLSSTNYPLRTIAERLSYSDEFAFSYAFKRCLGFSPRQFRQR